MKFFDGCGKRFVAINSYVMNSFLKYDINNAKEISIATFKNCLLYVLLSGIEACLI
jgi:hypothetical protein